MISLGKPRIVVLGAGVAGLRIAKKLSNKLRPGEADLLLVDQNDYHQLLYNLPKVCNYDYDEKDIIIPFKRIIQKIRFTQATAESVIPKENTVQTLMGKIDYDILVSALGSHPAYFGIEGAQENSLTFTGYTDAKKVREKILQLYEKTLETSDYPTIVIGGAGFTGVELAGEICEFIEKICIEQGIEVPAVKLHLVEATPTILPGWNKELAIEGARYLEKIGVELYLDDPVVEVGEGSLSMKSGVVLTPDLFIWTAGVQADPVCGLIFEMRARRIAVNEYLQPIWIDNVFIAGDQTCTVDSSDNPVPPSAHIAMEQADTVVFNVLATLRGKPLEAYRYSRVGEVVTLGEKYALGTFFGVTFRGSVAKLIKRLVHLWYVFSIGGFSLALEYL